MKKPVKLSSEQERKAGAIRRNARAQDRLMDTEASFFCQMAIRSSNPSPAIPAGNGSLEFLACLAQPWPARPEISVAGRKLNGRRKRTAMDAHGNRRILYRMGLASLGRGLGLFAVVGW